jgi:hypothetical protein
MLVELREGKTFIEKLADETLPFILVNQQLLEGGDDEIYPMRPLQVVGRGVGVIGQRSICRRFWRF